MPAFEDTMEQHNTGGIQHQLNRIKTFFGEMVEELKKCSWPTRDQLLQQTTMVIIVSLAASLFGLLVAFSCVKVLNQLGVAVGSGA
jgi:preprotein translocase SecE subunit